jgi:hypothetical protein
MTYFTSSTILLIHSPPIPGTVSTGIIFAFIYMCTHFFCTVFPFLPLSPTPLPSYWCQPFLPEQDLFCLPALQFWRKKRKDKTKNMTF